MPSPPLVIELPPCQPHAGINTDWSGNKCSQRVVALGEVYGNTYDTVSHVPLNIRITQTEPPKRKVLLEPPRPEAVAVQQPAPQAQADASTVAQEPASGGDHASMFSGIGFYIAVVMILALAFIVIRRIGLDFLDPFGGSRGVDRDDAE